MKFQQKDFDEKLKGEIKKNEVALKDHIEELLSQNKSVFAKKNLELDADFEKVGDDPFAPGYKSSISVGVAEENGELIDLHIIKIWECERTLLGMPIIKQIPGSKVVGELLDESLEEIKEELREYIEEILVGTN
ncbi:hypothetical protein V7075_11655 [Neobacillus drentensis]|uniref:hypothetical protein n=1 Tax=Neobacillus drentensis TaxID=220684 RepID=UPI002FFE7E0B